MLNYNPDVYNSYWPDAGDRDTKQVIVGAQWLDSVCSAAGRGATPSEFPLERARPPLGCPPRGSRCCPAAQTCSSLSERQRVREPGRKRTRERERDTHTHTHTK